MSCNISCLESMKTLGVHALQSNAVFPDHCTVQ
jgi:hypothetical protein